MKFLNFNQYLKLSEIADKIEIKSYQEYLERKLSKIDKDYKQGKKLPLLQEQKKELAAEKQLIMMVDVAMYITTKAWKVGKELKELFVIDGSMTIEEVNKMTGEDIFNKLKEMFSKGMPSILKNKFEEALKKTL
jgi:hypothetical protein